MTPAGTPASVRRLAAAVTLAAASGLGSCGDRVAERPRDSAAGSAEAEDAVRVWFHRGEQLVPVARPGVGDSLGGALEALVAGPTAAERGRGLGSWFGPATRDVLREVALSGGRATVDFDERLPALIPGAGSSAGSEALLAALDSTVFQFGGVEAVEYRLGGSCQAFWEWLQRSCALVRR